MAVIGGSEDRSEIVVQVGLDVKLVLSIPDEVVRADKYAWTFRFTY